jgi:hypothetical protein
MADTLLDVIDTISTRRHFVELVYLASHVASGGRSSDAIAAACDAAEKKLKEAEEIVAQHLALDPGGLKPEASRRSRREAAPAR